MTDTDQHRVAKALQGLEFPATKDQMLEYAETRNADPKTMQALSALAAGEYANSDEAQRAVPQEPDKAT